jgi:DNA repair photolyase
MSAPIEFVEIEAKSVLNRVQGMPFKWSINPYRGCSHACQFCSDGKTPILMADCTTRPLEEIHIGDQIYGTVKRGNYRRYARTFVLNHWSVEKPSYRIVLEDGTQLVASGDHRFLTERGWKFVIGAEQGPMTRPHLTTNNKLMGTGKFAAPPQRTIDYKRGYLCGLIRGDGFLGFYAHDGERRFRGSLYQFRLALTDFEGLERAQEYLLDFAVPTRRFVFQHARAGVRGVRAMDAIATQTRSRVEEVERIVGWPTDPSPDWRRGFLAGIFDAEGGYNKGSHNSSILRIGNTDPLIINCTTRCLEKLGFAFAIDWYSKPPMKPLKIVRLRGGLREHLRFFHTVDPAISRKRDIEGQAVKHNTRLRVVEIEPVGVRQLFDITTGTGDFIANGVVSHNCYARRTHWFLDEDGVNQWSSKIFVKINAPEVLRRELSRPGWRREEVALGTATDPYQAAERRYRITRGILEALRDYRTPVGIVTRSPLILRDLDILTTMAGRVDVTVCVSIATMDPALARQIEPTVAAPGQRLRAVERLAAAGIRTGVLLAPVLPGLTDRPESLAAVIRSARNAGAAFVGHRVLYLGEVTKDNFMQFLAQHYPDLLPLYRRMYPGQYAPRTYEKHVARIVGEEKQRAGPLESRYISPPDAPQQITLL